MEVTCGSLPNATIAIRNIHWGDGTVAPGMNVGLRRAESGLHESPSPPINSPAPPVTAEPSSLALFVRDEATRLVYEARLCACPDTVTLCQTVLTDLYNEILADYSSPLKLVKSRAFISALLPHLTFVNGANVPSIRYGEYRECAAGEGMSEMRDPRNFCYLCSAE